jgi:hypothetical protein
MEKWERKNLFKTLNIQKLRSSQSSKSLRFQKSAASTETFSEDDCPCEMDKELCLFPGGRCHWPKLFHSMR